MPVAALAAALRRTGQSLRRHAPSLCEVCRRWGGRLCPDCLARFAAPAPRCRRCGLRLGAEAPSCGECLGRPPPFERTVCAVDYAFPWDRLITAFKFGQQVDLAAPLAALLARAVERAGPPRPPSPPSALSAPCLLDTAPALLLPVPLSDARLRQRGYNQARELARHLSAETGVPTCADGLRRLIDTPAQAGLTRAERQCNLRAAFVADSQQRSSWQGRRVVLVDDVMTTGATLREGAAVLLASGAAAVEVWVLARTPAPA